MRLLSILFTFFYASVSFSQSCEDLKNLLEQEELDQAADVVVKLVKDGNCSLYVGEYYLKKGRNDLAQEYFEKSLSISEENSLEQAASLNNLGLVLWNTTGNFSKAQEYLLRALSIRKEKLGENHELVAASLNDLGLILSNNDPDAALDYYEKALSIYEDLYTANDARIARSKTNIGVAYRNIEFYGDAQSNFDEALKIWEAIYPEGHPNQGFLLLLQGQTNETLGNLDVAKQYYEKALSIFTKYHGEKHPDISNANRFIGNIYSKMSEYDKALKYYQTALIANSKKFNNESSNTNPEITDYINANVLLNCLYYKSQTLQGKFYNQTLKFKDLRASLDALISCDSLIDEVRRLRTSEADKISLGAIASQVYESGVRLCHSMANEAVKKQQYLEMSFYFAEKSKSAVLLEAISDASAKSFANIPKSELETESQYKAGITYLEQQMAESEDLSNLDAFRAKLLELTTEYNQFVKRLESEYPEYYNLKYNVSIPTISDVQNKLESDQALLSYFLDDTNQRVYIFEITPDKYNVYNVPQTENFYRYMSGFRNSIYFKEEGVYDLTAKALYKTLFPRKIANGAEHLVIIPAGRLGTLPFEALVTTGKGKSTYQEKQYLINKYSISYEYSSTLFVNKDDGQKNYNPTALLCAPITFENQVDLPGTKVEIDRLEEIFTSKSIQPEVFIESDANESTLKSLELQSHQYIHLATHGIVNEDNPELSRIFLNPGPSDDGNLYSGEIYNIKIDADLVTLSACETGLGKISKGEGIIGLSRALIYSGAANLMVSLWSVSDQSTTDLMINFYDKIDSSTYASTLRSAKMDLIKGGEYSEPYYWAPFILIGK